MHQGMPDAGFAPRADRRIGHEHAVEQDVMRAGPAHAERVPGLDDRDALRVHRHAELQHRRTIGGVLLDGAGHEQVGGRAPLRNLAGVDLVAAVDLDRLAGAQEPIGAAGRQELDAFGGDALEQAVGRRLLVAPAPGGGRSHVGMHRQGQGGRGAVVRQLAQHRRKLGPRQPGAAELRRHPKLEKTVLAQHRHVSADERVGPVAAPPLLRKLRTDLPEHRTPPRRGGRWFR